MWHRYNGIIVVGGLLACLLGTLPVQAATWCVGSAVDLTAALSAAESNGEDDLIQVVQGTYSGNFVYSTNEAYSLTIAGGYTADCATRIVDPANTVLDGQGAATVLALLSTGAADMAVDGVTLQHGVATRGVGGGLYVEPHGGNVALTHATLSGNMATFNGGGIGVEKADAVTIDHASINSNTALYGGGLHVEADTLTLRHVTLSDNTAGYDGGALHAWASILTLSHVTLSDNTAGYDGGGLRLGTDSFTLSHAVISDNTAGYNGGGAWVDATTVTIDHTTLSGNRAGCGNTAADSGGGLRVRADTLTLSHAVISGNTAQYNGGGISVWVGTLTLSNAVISDNTAGFDGGGLYAWASTFTLTHATVTANTATVSGGGVWVKLQGNSDQANIYNTIFWANDVRRGTGADLYLDNDGNGDLVPSPVNLYHNDVAYRTLSIRLPFPLDASNLDAQDPLFIDAARGDYHLQGGSPVIDRGDNTAPALPATDLDGNPRIINDVVDMGAYEYQGSMPCDANGDGHVDRRDAWELALYLWRDGEPLPGDADCHQDGEINFRDVLAILKTSR
jgi:hypothetical protein